MSRATQIADRKRIEAFFREMLRADRGIAAGTADTLAQRLASRIKRVVVWDTPKENGWDTPKENVWDDEQPIDPAAYAVPETARAPDPEQPAKAAPARVQEVREAKASSSAPVTDVAAAPNFDPYAFSAVVVLTKAGKDGLMKRLAAIERPEQLRKLADAQHLAVDASLSSIADLRTAIVTAAEQRIANRRAAAS